MVCAFPVTLAYVEMRALSVQEISTEQQSDCRTNIIKSDKMQIYNAKARRTDSFGGTRTSASNTRSSTLPYDLSPLQNTQQSLPTH